jgi:hypothetical protein
MNALSLILIICSISIVTSLNLKEDENAEITNISAVTKKITSTERELYNTKHVTFICSRLASASDKDKKSCLAAYQRVRQRKCTRASGSVKRLECNQKCKDRCARINENRFKRNQCKGKIWYRCQKKFKFHLYVANRKCSKSQNKPKKCGKWKDITEKLRRK